MVDPELWLLVHGGTEGANDWPIWAKAELLVALGPKGVPGPISTVFHRFAAANAEVDHHDHRWWAVLAELASVLDYEYHVLRDEGAHLPLTTTHALLRDAWRDLGPEVAQGVVEGLDLPRPAVIPMMDQVHWEHRRKVGREGYEDFVAAVMGRIGDHLASGRV